MNMMSRILFSILLFSITYGSLFYVTYALGTPDKIINSAATEICTDGVCKIPGIGIDEVSSAEYNSPNKIQYLTLANENFKNGFSHGKWFLFGIGAWLLGLMLVFTPCVLPLIILIAGFLSQSSEISQTRSTMLAITYVLALALTFSSIGVLAASFGIYLNIYFQNPWVLGTFSLILAFLALSLLGFYKIKLPRILQHFAAQHNKLQSNYHFIEVALMGVLGTLIASPCIAAPLVGVLSYISQSGNPFLGAYGLFLFGLGLGTPLVLVTTINKNILPKMGSWQYIIKFAFGIILFGVAIWISSRIIPASLNMLLWSILFVFTANYMFALTKDNAVHSYLLLWKTFSLIMLMYGLMIFVGFMLGNQSATNPLKIRSVNIAQFYKIFSLTSLDDAIVNANMTGMPVMVLFDADWCSECKEFKNQISNDNQVQRLLNQFTTLEINLTQPGSPAQEIAKKYKIAGVPEIIFFNTNGELNMLRIIGNIELEELKSNLIKIHNSTIKGRPLQ